jgi:hypothetical protein
MGVNGRPPLLLLEGGPMLKDEEKLTEELDNDVLFADP